MKWLKSTTQKTWTVGIENQQYLIPANETPDNRWLRVDEVEYSKLAASPVIASLIKAGGIMVLDQEPAELRNTVPQLQVTNTQLTAELEVAKARIVELEGQLKDATNIDIEAIKADAVAAVQAQLDAKQKELEELDAKASALIEEKDKKIAKLEKKLKGNSEE